MGRNITRIKKKKRQGRYQKRIKDRIKAARSERSGRKKKTEASS